MTTQNQQERIVEQCGLEQLNRRLTQPAPQATGVGVASQESDQNVEAILREQAERLFAHCLRHGYVLDIQLRHVPPLRMGGYQPVVGLRHVRAGSVLAEQAGLSNQPIED